MKAKKLWIVRIVVTVLLALVAVSTVLGQEPEPPLPPAEGEGGTGTEGEISIMAYPAKTMNYQGYLTDSGGSPLSGNYNMVFSLWDAEAAGTGTKEWGDETHTGVSVSNGIFSVVLGETVLLDPYTDFDEQLYLEIVVNGTTLPRQMLRAVPYAMGLTAGARAYGATDLTNQYGLYVKNVNGRGLYVDALDDNLFGIYNADVTYSYDGFAGPDTYLFVPTLNAVLPASAINYRLVPANGYYMRVISDAGSSVGRKVYVPLQIERPYGRDYVLKSARVYYKVGGGASIVDAQILGINFADGGQLTIGSDTSTHSSTTPSYFDITATSNNTVTTTVAPTSIAIVLDQPAFLDYVDLYGVRLRLDSTY